MPSCFKYESAKGGVGNFRIRLTESSKLRSNRLGQTSFVVEASKNNNNKRKKKEKG